VKPLLVRRASTSIPATCRVTDSEQEQAPMLTRDKYVAKMKKQLDEWNAEMDVLEAKVQATKEDAREKYQEQLVALRAKRQEGEKKLEAIKSATEDSWEQLKAEAENVWEAFKDSVNAFKAHFK
jgi:predicted  nucleic acid-binding Zn-ribbon protein